MKWVARILAGLVAVVVLAVLALLIAGKRPDHGQIVREIAIDRPAAQVFRWITTDELLKKWIGGLIELRPESSPAEGSEVGTKFRIVEAYKDERVDMEMEVMRFERDFEGLLVMTWDRKENAYKSYVFGNDFPECIVEKGNFESDLLVYRGEFPVGDQRVALRNTTRLTAPGHLVSEEFIKMEGQPEKLLVHVEAKKR